MTLIAYSPNTPKAGGFNSPDWKQFVLPYGPSTDEGYAGAAANAFGGMMTEYMKQPASFAGVIGGMHGNQAAALGNVANAYTGNYDAYTRGLGQAGANMANAYGSYGNVLGGLGNAAASGYGAMSGAIGGMRNADASAYGAYSNAAGQGYGNYSNALAAGQGASANALSGGYTGYGNTLSNIGGALSNNFGAFSSGLGSLSQSMANERGAMANANAIAESARQGSLGNIGAAALGAYGSAANSALAAWAQNQSSYNKSLADMNLANQGAVSQYGQSRNNALGTLGSAYGTTAAGSAPAAALGDVSAQFGGMDGGMGGMDFTADVGGDNLASGSFGGGGALGGLTGSVNRTSNPQGAQDIAFGAFGGIGDTRNSVMDNRVLDDLNAGAMRDGGRLDLQHMTSRNTPFTALDGILSGIRGMGSDAYGESRAGMDQFYGNAPAGTDFGSLVGLLQQGAGDSSRDINSLAGRASAGYGDLQRGIQSGADAMQSGLASGYGGLRQDLAGGLSTYSDGSADAYGALLGGYGGLNATLGGVMQGAGMGFNDAMLNQRGLAGRMGDGFGEANRGTTSALGELGSSYEAARGDVAGLADLFRPMPPAEQVRQEREAEMLRRQYGNQDAEALLASYRGREWAIPADLAKKAGLRWDGAGYYNPFGGRA
jgi:hypothetical protein